MVVGSEPLIGSQRDGHGQHHPSRRRVPRSDQPNEYPVCAQRGSVDTPRSGSVVPCRQRRHDVLGGFLGARLLPYLGREQPAIFPLRQRLVQSRGVLNPSSQSSPWLVEATCVTASSIALANGWTSANPSVRFTS